MKDKYEDLKRKYTKLEEKNKALKTEIKELKTTKEKKERLQQVQVLQQSQEPPKEMSEIAKILYGDHTKDRQEETTEKASNIRKNR